MTHTVTIGDSHGGIFQDLAPRWTTYSDAFTAERFRTGFEGIWRELDPWLRQQRPTHVVITAMEIDIRGHWWRHMPRTPDQSIAEQVKIETEKFYQSVEQFADRYSIERVVIWGPPPATARTTYNPDWPFVGPVTTRNRLIDAYNHEMIQRTTAQIGYATAFYDYVDLDTFRTVNYTETDGVHYFPSLGQQFWTGLVLPALSGFQQHRPPPQELNYTEQAGTNPGLYDTWIRTSDLAQAVTARTTQVDGNSYTYMTVRDNWAQWPRQYQELAVTGPRP
jgi:hypothetical protein